MTYGKCPLCGAPGISRERQPNGNDKCSNGHTYPSRTAIPNAACRVWQTAKSIDNMAETMLRYSANLKKTAAKMRESGDITYASEAMNDVTNCIMNLRLDQLVSRVIREGENNDKKD